MGTITAQIQLTEAELKLLQTLVYQECGMFFDERRSHFLKDRLQRRLKVCQLDSFYAAFAARKQAIVRVKRIKLANLQAALQAVFQEMRTAFIEKHAAFLVDKRLEQFKFCLGKLNLRCDRAHIA